MVYYYLIKSLILKLKHSNKKACSNKNNTKTYTIIVYWIKGDAFNDI